MFQPISAYSGFSVDDLEKAKEFYTEVLGLTVKELPGRLRLLLPENGQAVVYLKADHVPALYTTLNFEVADIDVAVGALKEKGTIFERYTTMPQDVDGILRGLSTNNGPDIAWFKDPAGNILSVVQSR